LFWLWVGLILFSQTALAGQWADAFIGLFLTPGPARASWLRFAAQKSYHVVLFGGMGALLALRTNSASKAEKLAWCVGFSIFAESLQTLASNRNASPWDALLNITAALGLYSLTARAGAPGSRQKS
jgi:hypothetical protein